MATNTHVDGLSEPHIVPDRDGKLGIYAYVSFDDKPEADFVVNLMHETQGYPLDDGGRVKKVTKEILAKGFDIVPNNELQFTSFTPQELAVMTEHFETTERNR